MPSHSQRVRGKKSLGQHFLVNASLRDQIVQSAEIAPGDTVLEIGAGTGVLTRRLAEVADRVLAVEIDETLHRELDPITQAHPNVEVIYGDVLELDLAELLRGIPREQVRVLGNLPYYVTTPILMRLLDHRSQIHLCVLMMQLEVAQRLVAAPGSRTYGAPSLAVAYHAEAEILKRVSPGSFRPPPKVRSAIVRLRMRHQPAVAVADEGRLFQIVRGAFQHRRKTLRNALRQSQVCEMEQLDRALSETEIPPGIRPEKLSVEAFGRLTNALVPSEPKV